MCQSLESWATATAPIRKMSSNVDVCAIYRTVSLNATEEKLEEDLLSSHNNLSFYDILIFILYV